MSEMPVAVRTEGGEAGIREHRLTRILAGDLPSAPLRLADALEQLGYQVLSEEPLLGRRAARGWAAWYVSSNVLDYPISLAIDVEPVNPGTTRVTFRYTLKHPLLSKSGRQTLSREAEAAVALAALHATSSKCVACGAAALPGTRFCRRCGMPSVAAEPSELEVLTVTAAACSAFHRAMIGTSVLGVSLLAAIGAWIFAGGLTNLSGGLTLALGLFGLAISLNGLWRLYRTLNPPRNRAPGRAGSELRDGHEQRATSPLSRIGKSAFDERTTALLATTPPIASEITSRPDRDREA